jgi:hypothetical protein
VVHVAWLPKAVLLLLPACLLKFHVLDTAASMGRDQGKVGLTALGHAGQAVAECRRKLHVYSSLSMRCILTL